MALEDSCCAAARGALCRGCVLWVVTTGGVDRHLARVCWGSCEALGWASPSRRAHVLQACACPQTPARQPGRTRRGGHGDLPTPLTARAPARPCAEFRSGTHQDPSLLTQDAQGQQSPCGRLRGGGLVRPGALGGPFGLIQKMWTGRCGVRPGGMGQSQGSGRPGREAWERQGPVRPPCPPGQCVPVCPVPPLALGTGAAWEAEGSAQFLGRTHDSERNHGAGRAPLRSPLPLWAQGWSCQALQPAHRGAGWARAPLAALATLAAPYSFFPWCGAEGSVPSRSPGSMQKVQDASSCCWWALSASV